METEHTFDTYTSVFLQPTTRLNVQKGPGNIGASVDIGSVRIDIHDPAAAERVADLFLRAAILLDSAQAVGA